MTADVVYQPFSRPELVADYLEQRGGMIDTHGNPLVNAYCAPCRTEHFTVEPHLAEVPCPTCGSTASRCRRPSGHDTAEWHRSRAEAFWRLCDEREAAGVAQVARWRADTTDSTEPTLSNPKRGTA